MTGVGIGGMVVTMEQTEYRFAIRKHETFMGFVTVWAENVSKAHEDAMAVACENFGRNGITIKVTEFPGARVV